MPAKKRPIQDLWAEFTQSLSGKASLTEENRERLYLIIKYVPHLRIKALKLFFCPTLPNFKGAMLSDTLASFGLTDVLEKAGNSVSGTDVVYVIRLMEEVPQIRPELWIDLLKHGAKADKYYLLQVIEKFPELRHQASGLFFASQHIQGYEMAQAMKHAEIRARGWEWIAKAPSHSQSCCCTEIMKKVPELKQEAWDKLVGFGMPNNALVNCIADFPDLQMQAWKILKKQKPQKEDLHLLISLVPEMRGEAEELLIKADDLIQRMIDVGNK